MSDTVGPATLVTANFAQQTANGPGSFSGATPPLLPAFLITGVLLVAIVFIVVWRHIIERRNLQREDDPTWPIDGLIGGGGGVGSGSAKGPTPKLWDLQVMSESKRAMWTEIMPLSAIALRPTPKPRRPRYLVPSDRPMTFLTRMFGGERRPLRLAAPPQPPIALLGPPQPSPAVQLPEDSDDEEPIDRLQVVVLISLPHPRRVQHTSHSLEKENERTTGLPPVTEKYVQSDCDGSEGEDTSHKGKKRSLESHVCDPRTYDGSQDEESMNEVAFGTVVLPYVGEG